jgi:GAF domain-containing protein
LAAGLAEATECLTRGARVDVNSVVQVALEAMFTGLGFARTALALRDPATGLYRTRAAFGEPKPQFGFGAQSAPNLFTAALSQHKDLHITDCAADKVRASLPDWFARDFPQARSFLLMPLVVGDKLVGFFYADRPVPDPAGLSAQELNLLRALRSQVVLALRSR